MWIFTHGLINLKFLSQYLGISIAEIYKPERSRPAMLNGYKRAFGTSTEHNPFRTFSTLISAADGQVQGLAVKVTSEELARLDIVEGYPDFYDRINVQVQDLSQSEPTFLDGQAYQMVDPDLFIEPDDHYLKEVCKTIYDSRKLLGDTNNRQVDVEVFNAITGEQVRVFSHEVN